MSNPAIDRSHVSDRPLKEQPMGLDARDIQSDAFDGIVCELRECGFEVLVSDANPADRDDVRVIHRAA